MLENPGLLEGIGSPKLTQSTNLHWPRVHLEICVILGTPKPFIRSEGVVSILGQYLGN